MKNIKFYTILFLVFICLLFNTAVNAVNLPTTNIFREGVYQVGDFNIAPNNLYYVQNASNDEVLLQIYDEHKVVQQYMTLPPSSRKFTLIPLKPEYRVVILGKGDLYITIGWYLQ